MKLKPIFFLALAFGLYSVSQSLELRGDIAPIAKDGVSHERLQYHLMALVFLLAAFGFFISAGVSAVRGIRGR
jgi:hypothetical protein